MPARPEDSQAKGFTRRSFLGTFSLGLATIAGAGFLFRNILFSRGDEDGEPGGDFPGEDSIFHPRGDPREEARERNRRG